MFLQYNGLKNSNHLHYATNTKQDKMVRIMMFKRDLEVTSFRHILVLKFTRSLILR